jgi:hypothetical protein
MRKRRRMTLVSPLVAGLSVIAAPVGATVTGYGESSYTVSAAPAMPAACMPSPPRFKNFTTVKGTSGRIARDFGTLRWTKGRLEYDVRSGFLIDVCLANVDDQGNEGGVSGLRFRGPAQGSDGWPGLNVVGFGSVRVPVATDLGNTGAPVSLPVTAAGGSLILIGAALIWLRARGVRRRRPDVDCAGGGSGA